MGRVLKNSRAARAVCSYEQVRAVLCKTTTWNYHIYRFDEYLRIQVRILSDVFLAVSVIIAKLGSFSNNDGNGNDNATN